MVTRIKGGTSTKLHDPGQKEYEVSDGSLIPIFRLVNASMSAYGPIPDQVVKLASALGTRVEGSTPYLYHKEPKMRLEIFSIQLLDL